MLLLFACRLDDERWSLPWALHAAARDARTPVGNWLVTRLPDEIVEADPSPQQVQAVITALSDASVAGGQPASVLLAAASLVGTHANQLADPDTQMAARRELVPALVALAAANWVPFPSPVAAVLSAACLEVVCDPDPTERGLAAAVARVPAVLSSPQEFGRPADDVGAAGGRSAGTAETVIEHVIRPYTRVLSAMVDERASMQQETYLAWDMLDDPTAAVSLALLANHARAAQQVPPAAVRTWVLAHTAPVLNQLRRGR